MKLKEKVSQYPFYANLLTDNKHILYTTLSVEQGLFTLENLEELIIFIDGNNASTLIGTCDFSRFTQIRENDKMQYYTCENSETTETIPLNPTEYNVGLLNTIPDFEENSISPLE